MNRKKVVIIIAATSIFIILGVVLGMHNMDTKNDGIRTDSYIKDIDEKTSAISEEPSKIEDNKKEYISITMEEAKQIFAKPGDYVILDVRRPEEFAQGHIPEAINIANEDIGNKPLTELSDKNKEIYVYCRSGRRSKEAAAKLVELGYTNIYECGGILDWTGEVI